MIGIIGKGFVGGAVFEGFKQLGQDVVAWDKNTGWHGGIPDRAANGITEIAKHSDIVFVCVPTPMTKSGACDTSIVESVVDEINSKTDYFKELVVVIKSTVVPGTTRRLNEKYKNIQCVFNPEFLRENSAVDDFLAQDRIVIGGPYEACEKLASLYQKTFSDVPTHLCSSDVAEMAKYTTNAFLSTKVTFANAIYGVCKDTNIDYNAVAELVALDSRIGKSHLQVPGPDGRPGYGGKCLPKDLSGLAAFAKENSAASFFEYIELSNLFNRGERDWETISGVISEEPKQ